MKPLFTLPLLLVLATCSAVSQISHAQSPLPTDEIRTLIENFNGTAGVYVKHLPTGQTLAINADTVFPTASMVKVPIMVALFDKIEQGELTYRQTFFYDSTFAYAYFKDVISNMADSSAVSLDMLIHLMMSTSNNTASIWNQHIAGTGTYINEVMAAYGLEHTRMNSRTPGREEAWRTYGWGQTTPREMATLVEKIFKGEVVSEHASEQMYRIMSRNFWDGEALSEIPPHIKAVSKNGAVTQSKSEVVLVNAPSGDYVFCVITKNQDDRRWEVDNEGYVLIREISRILFRHFEPNEPWQPNPNTRIYW